MGILRVRKMIPGGSALLGEGAIPPVYGKPEDGVLALARRKQFNAPMHDPRLEQFLTDRLQGVPHSAGDLLSHFRGTHDLLRRWGSPEAVCLAGLLHGVYGTWHVSHQTLKLSERGTLRTLIGEEAEALVYLFAVTERPKDFIECLDRHPVRLRDHHAGTDVVLPREMLDRLLEIEAANIIEQNEPADAILGQCLRARLSPGAVVGIEGYLAGRKARSA